MQSNLTPACINELLTQSSSQSREQSQDHSPLNGCTCLQGQHKNPNSMSNHLPPVSQCRVTLKEVHGGGAQVMT
eukprot:1160793-Pelagomonas_calceolata.AAC.12